MKNLIIISLLFLACNPIESIHHDDIDICLDESPRPTVTFIMGEDKSAIKYFELAEQYFTFHPIEKTEILVKHCRSFSEMYDYILNDKPESTPPWGRVEVVLHGNAWHGLQLPLDTNGDRCTGKTLMKAAITKKFEPIPDHVLDSLTVMTFHGCGIGKNPLVVAGINKIFQANASPKIHVSDQFVVFTSCDSMDIPMKVNANYWPYIFRRGYRPSDIEIAMQLKSDFPNASINWRDALLTQSPDSAFHQSFHLPIVHYRFYAEDTRPQLNTEKSKMDWLRNEPQILKKLEEVGLHYDDFTWTIYPMQFEENGTSSPAIKAVGMATILCVLQI